MMYRSLDQCKGYHNEHVMITVVHCSSQQFTMNRNVHYVLCIYIMGFVQYCKSYWKDLVSFSHHRQRVISDIRYCYNMVQTPTLCLPDMSDRPCYFLFNLLNLATFLYHMWCTLTFTFIVLLSIVTLLCLWHCPYTYCWISLYLLISTLLYSHVYKSPVFAVKP